MFRRFHSPSRRPLAALLVGLLLMTGCGASDDDAGVPGEAFYPAAPTAFQQPAAQRDSVFTVLDRVEQASFRQAFADLDTHRYTRYTRTEQFDRDDYLLAYREHVVRHDPHGGEGPFTTVETDTAGAFDFGYFNDFISTNADLRAAVELGTLVLPDDPPYLSPRKREAFHYRFLPDTLMWDMVARVIEIRAAPETGDAQNVRRVRMYIDRDSDSLVGIYMERVDLSLFFREESRFYLNVRPAEGGTWVPYNTRFESRIRVPFRPPQLFRTVSTYYGFGQQEASA